jgi:hypothetical protein
MSHFYHYRQNNSGGQFIIDDSVTVNVYIEANSSREADYKATDIGIYFDGVNKGMDCECCGDRWYGAYEEEEINNLNDFKKLYNFDFWTADFVKPEGAFPETYVYTLDGKKHRIGKEIENRNKKTNKKNK